MPWQGWDERSVRPQRQAATQSTIRQAPGSATIGFTAINPSSPGLEPADSATPARVAASQSQHATVASAYLGRGEQEQPLAPSKPATKKATTKGKKRAATASDSKGNKRRKTSNVSEAMPAKKPRVVAKKQRAAKPPAENGSNVDQTALHHEQVSKTAKATFRASKSAAGDADSTLASSLVSVIAPSTSIGALQSMSQQTSVDAVKSSSSHGSILYSSSPSPAKQQNGIRFSQPLSDQARASTNIPNHGYTRRDRNQHISRHDDQAFDDEDDDFGTLFDELAQQIEGSSGRDSVTSSADTRRNTRSASKKLRQRPTPKAKGSSKEDSFIEEDDELAEAMVLAEKAMKSSKPAKKKSTPAKHPKQLQTPANSDTIQQGARNTVTQTTPEATEKHHDTIMIDSDDEDEEMIELDKAIREAEKMGLKPRLLKQNIHSVDQHEDYGGALLDDAEKQLLDELKSASQSSDTRPIVRSSFPQPVLDRSPIFGAANTTMLRTCFRLGEALNVGSHAIRTNRDIILEIYARVASSFRDGRKQHFLFRDLYHDKPPHVEGDFELWSQSRLWDMDGKAFMKAEERAEGVMCRAVARMKRDGTKWRLEVLSIWEAGWEDVEAVAGIYASGGSGVGINED